MPVPFFYCVALDNLLGSNLDNLAKSRHEAPGWLDKKFDIQGVVFLAGLRLYMWYVEGLKKPHPAGDKRRLRTSEVP